MKSLQAQIQKYKRLVIILVIISVILFVIVLTGNNRQNSASDLTIETVKTRDVERKVSADGYVEGVDKRIVFFTPNLKVTEVRYKVGDQVNQDDVLAVLTTNDGRNINTEVKSPIGGIVTEYNYKQNDIVSAVNSAGVVIVNKSSYKIELLVNENDIADVMAGQKAKILYSALSIEDEFDGEVETVYPDATSESAAVSYKVIVKPTAIPEFLKLGMSASVVITTATAENVLSVPESYIVEKDDKTYLKFLNWTDSNKTNYEISEKEVTLGLTTDEYVEVKSGVSEGDEIVEPNFEPSRLSIFGR